MTLQIGRFTPYEQLATSSLARPVESTPRVPQTDVALGRTLGGAAHEGTILGDIPPAPTAEARELVDRAAERAQELFDKGRELHFSHDEHSNRVVIEVRDLEGNVIKTIPPTKAMDVLSGAEL